MPPPESRRSPAPPPLLFRGRATAPRRDAAAGSRTACQEVVPRLAFILCSRLCERRPPLHRASGRRGADDVPGSSPFRIAMIACRDHRASGTTRAPPCGHRHPLEPCDGPGSSRSATGLYRVLRASAVRVGSYPVALSRPGSPPSRLRDRRACVDLSSSHPRVRDDNAW